MIMVEHFSNAYGKPDVGSGLFVCACFGMNDVN